MSFHCLLLSIVSEEMSSVNLIEVFFFLLHDESFSFAIQIFFFVFFQPFFLWSNWYEFLCVYPFLEFVELSGCVGKYFSSNFGNCKHIFEYFSIPFSFSSPWYSWLCKYCVLNVTFNYEAGFFFTFFSVLQISWSLSVYL